MRRMTMRQAITCETAEGRRCRCRCGGLLHGRGRVSEAQIAGLPEEDPHHALPPKRRMTARQRAEAAGQLMLPFDDALVADTPRIPEPNEVFAQRDQAVHDAVAGEQP